MDYIDTILSRHENPHHTPKHYPNWSEEGWDLVMRTHKEALETIEYDRRIAALWEERREEEEKIAKEEKLSELGRILVTLSTEKAEKQAQLKEITSNVVL
jgi:hypothetical protein